MILVARFSSHSGNIWFKYEQLQFIYIVTKYFVSEKCLPYVLLLEQPGSNVRTHEFYTAMLTNYCILIVKQIVSDNPPISHGDIPPPTPLCLGGGIITKFGGY